MRIKRTKLRSDPFYAPQKSIICQSSPLRWQQRFFGRSKRIFELREVALRDGMPGNSVADRPGVFRQVIGPKQSVEQRKMNGKININRRLWVAEIRSRVEMIDWRGFGSKLWRYV